MAPRVRLFERSDYPAFKLVHDENYPAHPLSLETSKHEDWWFGRTRFKLQRYVVETDGRVVGVGSFFHEVFTYKPNVYCIRVEVHPSYQRRGIGSLLCEKLLYELRELGAELAWATAILPSSSSSKFAEAEGFVQTRLELESELDLSRFDPRQVGPAVDRIRKDGIEISTVANELGRDPEAGRKVYELEMRAGDDVPRVVESEEITYDEYSMVILQNPTYLPFADFVAKVGDRFVGSSNIWKSGPPGYLTQGFTAVRKDYRRRGVATALKLMVAKAASDMGARYVRTSNDSANDRMLNLNSKLGFKRTLAWATYEKRLA